MPSEARRLHGFTVVSGALRLARQLILPAILGGASAGGDIASTLQWVALILTVPSLALSFARWLMFRYRVEADELIIDSGVLSRRRRVIPLSRIQNIDLQQSAIERLARVAELRMETASGGSETEASLAVLSLPEARELQTELMRRRARQAGAGAAGVAADPGVAGTAGVAEREEAGGAGGASAAESGLAAEEGETQRRVLRLSIGDLAVAGATSNEAGLLAAGLATGLQLADDLGGVDRVQGWLEAAFTRGAALGIMGAVAAGVALAVAVILVGWVASIFVTVVRYHGFTLTRVGDDVRREFGLFSRHHSTVPLERVQAVRIEQTLLRRPFGLVALKVETAGAGPQQRRGEGGSEAFVPIARKREVGTLLREVFPDARFEGVELQPVSPRSRRRTFSRLAAPVALAALVCTVVLGPRWLALLALLAPAWLYARADYRARAWARPPGYALVRGGVFTRVSWVVPESKIQTLHLRDTPFQRRLDLRTLLVDTAAGGRVARVVDLERSTADSLLHALTRDAEAARRSSVRSPRQGPRGTR